MISNDNWFATECITYTPIFNTLIFFKALLNFKQITSFFLFLIIFKYFKMYLSSLIKQSLICIYSFLYAPSL